MRHSAKILVLSGLVAWTSASRGQDIYAFDTAHTQISFGVRHLGLVNVRGSFREFSGAVTMEGADLVGARAVIKVTTIDTNSKNRDDHLRNPEFFEVEAYPEITFESTSVEKRETGVVVKGRFTMKKTTREIEIPMTLVGPIDDPWGNRRVGLTGSVVVNRKDYGVSNDKASDRAIGEDVTVSIDIQAVMAKPAA